MFLEKYIDSEKLNTIYNTYEEVYLNSLDEDNFKRVYNLLNRNNFLFLDDIIVNYLELFEIEAVYVNMALYQIKKILGDNYIDIIANNMTLIDKMINLAIEYSNQD